MEVEGLGDSEYGREGDESAHAAILDRVRGNRHRNSADARDTPRYFPVGFHAMGKTVAASRAELPNWFHVGVIAPPGYDPPGLEAQVCRKLAKLLGPKSRTHKIGIYGVWAEPVSRAVVESSKESGWHLSGYAVDRGGGKCAWLRAWLMIAVTCDAMIVFGPSDPTMEIVLGLCREVRCGVRRI